MPFLPSFWQPMLCFTQVLLMLKFCNKLHLQPLQIVKHREPLVFTPTVTEFTNWDITSGDVGVLFKRIRTTTRRMRMRIRRRRRMRMMVTLMGGLSGALCPIQGLPLPDPLHTATHFWWDWWWRWRWWYSWWRWPWRWYAVKVLFIIQCNSSCRTTIYHHTTMPSITPN